MIDEQDIGPLLDFFNIGQDESHVAALQGIKIEPPCNFELQLNDENLPTTWD